VAGGGGSNSQKLGVGVVADQLSGVTSSVVDYVNSISEKKLQM